jgi:putative ABC transport system permease protein
MADINTLVQYDNRSLNLRIVGVYPAWQSIRRMDIGEGRLLAEGDEASRARRVVVGDEVVKKLFAGQNALGNSIRIGGLSFEIVGILKHKVQDGDENDNRMLIIPFSTMGDLKDTHYVQGLFIEYEGMAYVRVAESVRRVMAAHHEFDPKDRRAIYVWNLMEDIQQFRIITTGIKVLLTFIGMLTLGIGGVGLMNIMLVAVTQRTREIGVEKALGAPRKAILMQFLSEALAITAIGGIAGVILAYTVAYSVGSLTLFSAFAENAQDADIHLRIDPTILITATVILAVVGIVSGMLPAIKASRLDPVEALRYE